MRKETKLKKIVGIARLYDHSKLLAWLDFIGLSLSDWVLLNFQTRKDFLLDMPKGIVVRKIPFENITPTIGFNAVAKFLSGNVLTPVEGEVRVHAFGSSNVPPTMADTRLGNETARQAVASKTHNGASAFYTVFYGPAEANGTHAEMGLFINADPAIANHGVLWDRSLINLTKDNTQSLTLDYEDVFMNNV